MSLAATIKGTAARAARRCGGGATVTIRRSGPGLVDNTTGQKLSALAVNGLVAAGGSTLDLDATSIQGGGILGQGWQFTLPGHDAPYEVQADVTAVSNALLSVSLLPVLSHDATDDMVLTISRHYGEWTYQCYREVFEREQVGGEVIEADDYKLVVSLLGASFTDIQKAGDVDRVVFDGKARSIQRIMPIEPGTDPAVLRLHCRG